MPEVVDREDTQLLLLGQELAKLTHKHQLPQSLIQKRQPRSWQPMWTKQHSRKTHTMAHAKIDNLDIVAEPAGYAIALISLR